MGRILSLDCLNVTTSFINIIIMNMNQDLLIDMPLDCQVVGLEEKVERHSVASSSLLFIVFIFVIIDIRFIFTILIVILQHGCRDETSHSRESMG